MRGKPDRNRHWTTILGGALGALAAVVALSGFGGAAASAQPSGDVPEAVSADATVAQAHGAGPWPGHPGGPWDVPAGVALDI